jgi:outer membrane protein OmpA-like peptidoglycan-associated protein
MLAAMGWLLAGCSTISSMNPVNWWHRQEGGKIAQDRPPPPGADQAYPNISTVPAKPEPPNADELKKLTDSLVADRTNAQHAAEAAPLADPSSPTASPALFGVGTAPPPPPPGLAGSPPVAGAGGGSAAASAAPIASASMPAVTAPPAPAAPPSPAPRKPVQSTPLEAPQPAAAPSAPAAVAAGGNAAAAASAAPAAVAPPAVPVAPAAGDTIAGPAPTLPAAPPPRPAVAGAPPPPVVVPTPMPAPPAGQSATIVFENQASNLGSQAADEVKAFAAKRGTGTISVIGYGDSASSAPEAQSAALNLGLSRAQSIVDVLKSAGVPGTAIRVSAEASGRGASLQLLQ